MIDHPLAMIDQVQEYWNRRPCNIRHSNKPLGSREYFDEVVHRKLLAEPHLVGFSDFQKWKGLRVLEIGCGLGTAAVNFARNGAIYTGVDLSQESLDLARRRFEVYNLKGDFYQANAEQLTDSVPLCSYDLVYSWGVIHHTPNPPAVVEQAKHFMKSGTIFKVMVYAKNSWKNFMIEQGLDQPEAQAGCPVAFVYDNDQARDLIGPDFDIISIEQDHIFPYQVEPYKQGDYVLQPWFAAMPPEMFRALELKLGWHLMITARKK